MSKRKETLQIEETLRRICQEKRIYGCEEVTIGFPNNGHGNEVVDFCTMDSKGILRCYEIKVTLADLKSKAKKSWYGHYNYLFITSELYEKIRNNLSDYIPDHVGVVIQCSSFWSCGVENKRRPKKQPLSSEDENMLKESMIRSMSYKLQKCRNASDLEEMRKLQGELRQSEKERKKYEKEAFSLRYVMSRIKRILSVYYGKESLQPEEIVPLIDNRRVRLPETITLSLTERGRQYNEKYNLYQQDDDLH